MITNRSGFDHDTLQIENGLSDKCDIYFHIFQLGMKHNEIVELLGRIHFPILVEEFMKIVLLNHISRIQNLDNEILEHFKLIRLKEQEFEKFLK
jgi:hypothetical protein